MENTLNLFLNGWEEIIIQVSGMWLTMVSEFQIIRCIKHSLILLKMVLFREFINVLRHKNASKLKKRSEMEFFALLKLMLQTGTLQVFYLIKEITNSFFNAELNQMLWNILIKIFGLSIVQATSDLMVSSSIAKNLINVNAIIEMHEAITF